MFPDFALDRYYPEFSMTTRSTGLEPIDLETMEVALAPRIMV